MMINLIGIRVGDKYYITEYRNGRYKFPEYIINSIKPDTTFHPSWASINSEPKSIGRFVSGERIEEYYLLNDVEMESDALPLRISVDDYKEMSPRVADAFYDRKIVYGKERFKELDFTFDCSFEFDKLPNSIIQGKKLIKEGVLNGIKINYQLLDTIVFPELLWNTRPVYVSSEDMFKIVRGYIKEHIDYDVALIEHDGESFFKVAKRVKLNTPKEYTVDLNAGTKRRKKLVKKVAEFKTINVLDIEPKNSNYSHKLVEPIYGNNLEDLNDKINKYLTDLIDFINTPIKECPHCNGLGMVMS